MDKPLVVLRTFEEDGTQVQTLSINEDEVDRAYETDRQQLGPEAVLEALARRGFIEYKEVS